jgi:phage antirepressor YoqD-like protein
MNENEELRQYGFVSDDEIVSRSANITIFTLKIVSEKLNIKGLGRNKLYSLLRDKGYIDEFNCALDKYVEDGCFINSKTYRDLGGVHGNTNQVLVTIKGLELIKKLVKD